MASVRDGFIRSAPLIDARKHYLMDYDGIGFLKASGADSLSVGYKTASGPKPALRSGRLKGFVRHQSGFWNNDWK
ncbi:hypothetical protein N9P68_01155 [Pseudomonadales bacterium]|nr:hypothetical protein [Pseudomonadales bacterium]